MAIRPKNTSPIPAKAFHSRRSPSTKYPSKMALMGIKNVTSRIFVAPAVARTRK